jgi:hypothetical protein
MVIVVITAIGPNTSDQCPRAPVGCEDAVPIEKETSLQTKREQEDTQGDVEKKPRGGFVRG